MSLLYSRRRVAGLSFLVIVLFLAVLMFSGMFPEASASVEEAVIDAEPPEIVLVGDGKTIFGDKGSYCWRSIKGGNCALSKPAYNIVTGQNATNVSQDASLHLESQGTEANKYTYDVYSLGKNNSHVERGNATDSFNLSTLESGMYAVSGSGWWDKGDAAYAFKIRLTE
jgi:hypothetical protein